MAGLHDEEEVDVEVEAERDGSMDMMISKTKRLPKFTQRGMKTRTVTADDARRTNNMYEQGVAKQRANRMKTDEQRRKEREDAEAEK